MATVTFREWLTTTLAPTWLRETWAGKWLGVLGDGLDRVMEGAKVAVKASMPTVAPVDALPWIGSARRLPRYPGETDDQYRARLVNAFDAYAFAGASASIIGQLNAAGFANVSVYDVRTAPSWYVALFGAWPPGGAANWSRIWLEISTPTQWQRVRWGDVGRKWGDGHTWGSTATHDEIALVRSIIRKWKAAHDVCATIFVRFDNGGGSFTTLQVPGMA